MKYTWRNRALAYLQVSNNKYNNAAKVSREVTPKGNYRLYYDGHDTGMTIGRAYL